MNPETNTQALQERQSRINRLIKSAQSELHTAKKQLEQAIQEEHPNEYLRAELVKQADALVKSIELQLENLGNQLSLLRVPSNDELRYRKSLLENFSSSVGEKAAKLPNIRFHGAGWLQSVSIITGGELSSSQERGLDRSSFDVSGQISVTDAQSVELSLRDYTGIKDFFLPMGCIFVLQANQMESLGNTYAMESVKLKENGKTSKRFVKVLTSSEMLPKMKELLRQKGYDPQLAQEYGSYVDAL